MMPLMLATVDAVTDPDVEALSAWSTRGDRAALEELFRRHAAACLRLARRRLPEAAEDAVQDAFIAVMRGARSYRPARGSVLGWLLAAVAHACANRRRGDARRRRRERGAMPPAAVPGDPDLAEAVRAALDVVPERHRLPVELRYLDGREFADIARLLGRKEKTVRSQVDRGLAALRAALRRQGVDGAPVAALAALAALPTAGASDIAHAAAATIARSGPSAAAAVAPAAATAAVAVVLAGCGVLAGLWRASESSPTPMAAQPAPLPPMAAEPPGPPPLLQGATQAVDEVGTAADHTQVIHIAADGTLTAVHVPARGPRTVRATVVAADGGVRRVDLGLPWDGFDPLALAGDAQGFCFANAGRGAASTWCSWSGGAPRVQRMSLPNQIGLALARGPQGWRAAGSAPGEPQPLVLRLVADGEGWTAAPTRTAAVPGWGLLAGDGRWLLLGDDRDGFDHRRPRGGIGAWLVDVEDPAQPVWLDAGRALGGAATGDLAWRLATHADAVWVAVQGAAIPGRIAAIRVAAGRADPPVRLWDEAREPVQWVIGPGPDERLWWVAAVDALGRRRDGDLRHAPVAMRALDQDGSWSPPRWLATVAGDDAGAVAVAPPTIAAAGLMLVGRGRDEPTEHDGRQLFITRLPWVWAAAPTSTPARVESHAEGAALVLPDRPDLRLAVSPAGTGIRRGGRSGLLWSRRDVATLRSALAQRRFAPAATPVAADGAEAWIVDGAGAIVVALRLGERRGPPDPAATAAWRANIGIVPIGGEGHPPEGPLLAITVQILHPLVGAFEVPDLDAMALRRRWGPPPRE